MVTPMTDRRDELLDVLADHVQSHGIGAASIRTLAAAAGVAHNTLTHHFGSRAELVNAIFERISQRLLAPDQTGSASPAERLRGTWSTITGSPYATTWPVFYELVGLALRAPEEHRGFLERVAHGWVRPLADELVALGHPEPDALASATFVVATVRGLVLDLVCGGEPARVQAALDLLVAQVEAVAVQH